MMAIITIIESMARATQDTANPIHKHNGMVGRGTLVCSCVGWCVGYPQKNFCNFRKTDAPL